MIGMASGRSRGAGVSLRAPWLKNNEQDEKDQVKVQMKSTPAEASLPFRSQQPGSATQRLALDLTAYAGVSKEISVTSACKQ